MTDRKRAAQPTDETERARRQRSRSVAIALALGAMCLLFYAATMVRMRASVVPRPLVVQGSFVR